MSDVEGETAAWSGAASHNRAPFRDMGDHDGRAAGRGGRQRKSWM